MANAPEECCRGLQNESAIGARALGDHIGQTREQTEMTQRQIAELQGIRNPASNAALSLREAITSLQEQQLHLAQEIAQCRASLEAFQNLLPFRIYRNLARNIKALWRAIRPHNSAVIAPLREGAVTSETPHPAVSPTDRRVA